MTDAEDIVERLEREAASWEAELAIGGRTADVEKTLRLAAADIKRLRAWIERSCRARV